MSDDFLEQEEMIRVAEDLEFGIPRADALAAAGISKERYHRIQQLAKAGEEPYSSWLEGLVQAEAEAKVKHLRKLAESPDWRCRKELLMMSHPDLFSGGSAEHEKTYDWMLRVIEQESDQETFERIIRRFATEEPGEEAVGQASEDAEGQLH